MELVSFRPAKTSDLPYIYNSMLKAMRAEMTEIRTSMFYSIYQPKVQNLIEKSDIQIACYEKDKDLIYGYLVTSNLDDILIIHWINVKKPFRRLGIATALLKSIGKDKETAALASWKYPHTEVTDRHLIKFKKELQTATYR